MENDEVLRFLAIYENYPEIWDSKNPNHKNRNKVADAWKAIKNQISSSTDVSEEDLKRKKDCLMSTYRSLRKKVIQSAKSGSGADEIYKPSWFAYIAMESFLKSTGNIRKTLYTEGSTADERNEQSEIHAEGSTISQCTSWDSNESYFGVDGEMTPSKIVGKKRKEPIQIEQTMKQAATVLESICRQREQRLQDQNDECNLYGQLLATKLRALPTKKRKVLIRNIDNLVFSAEMEEFDVDETLNSDPLYHTSLCSPYSQGSVKYVNLPEGSTPVLVEYCAEDPVQMNIQKEK